MFLPKRRSLLLLLLLPCFSVRPGLKADLNKLTKEELETINRIPKPQKRKGSRQQTPPNTKLVKLCDYSDKRLKETNKAKTNAQAPRNKFQKRKRPRMLPTWEKYKWWCLEQHYRWPYSNSNKDMTNCFIACFHIDK